MLFYSFSLDKYVYLKNIHGHGSWSLINVYRVYLTRILPGIVMRYIILQIESYANEVEIL